ncbi:MAG: enoyl-CoA hydratase-related protein [Methylococcales bacterium]
MTYKTVKLSRQNKVAIVTLNDPDTRNAITDPVLLEEVKDVFDLIQHDQEISVCILTGEGKGFSSGGNIKDMINRTKMFAGDPLELQRNYRNGIHSLTKLLYSLEIPVIAAVNGAAIGAGFDLTLLCDLRIGSERATFSSSFINLGLIAGDGGTWLLRKALGAQRAVELVLTGRTIDAQEALEMGLLLSVVKHEELIDAALDLANIIASKPRDTLVIAKRLIKSTDTLSYEDHLNLCSANQAMLHQAPAHEEALKGFYNRIKK